MQADSQSAWATPHTIEASTHLSLGGFESDGQGLILGEFGGRYLRDDGGDPVLLIGPCRSGKSSGVIIPNLLSQTGSVVVNDHRGDAYHATAAWRSTFSEIIYFDPLSNQSHRYNPLAAVAHGIYRLLDVSAIANALIPPTSLRAWADGSTCYSRRLLFATILYLLDRAAPGSPPTLNEVADFLQDPSRSIPETLDLLRSDEYPQVSKTAQDCLALSEEKRSEVWTSAVKALAFFRQPTVSRATSTCDFGVSDLRHASRPVSLYLVMAPWAQDQLRPLWHMILGQMLKHLSASRAAASHPLLLMFDDLQSLHHMPFLEASLPDLAARGIKMVLSVQKMDHLYQHYGAETVIPMHCGAKLAFCPMITTADQAFLGHDLGQQSELIEQALLLVLPAQTLPIRAQRVSYFDDPNCSARLAPAPPPMPRFS